MQTAFPYRIFIFNWKGNCRVSTQFCKYHWNLMEASILWISTKWLNRNYEKECYYCLTWTFELHGNCSRSCTPDLQYQFHSHLCAGLCNRAACKNVPPSPTDNNLRVEFSVLMVLYYWHTLCTSLTEKQLHQFFLSEMVKPEI